LLLTVVPLVFLIALLVVAWALQDRVQRSNASTEHASRVLAASDGIVRALTDMNSAAASYVRTHAPSAFADVARGRAVVRAREHDFRVLMGDDPYPAHVATANRLLANSDALVALLVRYADLLHEGRKSEADRLVARPSTRRVGTAFTTARAAFDAGERMEMIEHFEAQRRDVQLFDRILFVGLILGAVLTLAVAAAFGIRLTRRLSRLADNAQRLGNGLPATPLEGDDEIATINGVYSEMAARIARTALEKETALEAYRQEHVVATRLQRALLPQELTTCPGVRFDGVYEPGANATIGGDWYDAVRLADGRVLVSIGDVTGRGLEAAVVMASMRQVIRGVAQIYPDPAAMIDAADRTLKAEYADTVVTAFVGVYDSVTGTLAYCCAGHPPPLVRERDGTVLALSSRGLPLGLRLRGGGEADARTLAIADGALPLFYTDGLIEAQHDVIEGERLLYAALAAADGSSSSIARAIFDHVLPDGASDDVAILAMSIDGAPTHDRRGNAGRNRWTFDAADARAGRRARHELAGLLGERGLSYEHRMTAELIFGEVLSNAVRYAPGEVDVVLDCERDSAVLHVLDRGAGFIVIPRLPSDMMSETGRGLFLISALAEEFNVTKRPGGGAHVRVVLPTRTSRMGATVAREPLYEALPSAITAS
jgi:serine phosphatase RsbU (regulator of sigma subunit)/anti-sigma regulatory factor (Ser/Thr protein kinase)/CHASE3 domain sensor protein